MGREMGVFIEAMWYVEGWVGVWAEDQVFVYIVVERE